MKPGANTPAQQEGLTAVAVEERLTPDETIAAARAIKGDASIDAPHAAAVVKATRPPRQKAHDSAVPRRPIAPSVAPAVHAAPVEGLGAAVGVLDRGAVLTLLRYGIERPLARSPSTFV